jgi:aspartate racemase
MKRLAIVCASGIELTAHYARIITAEVEHRYSRDVQPDFITLTLQKIEREKTTTGDFTSKSNALLCEALASVARLGAEAVLLCARGGYAGPATEIKSLLALSIHVPVVAALHHARLRRIGLLGAHTSYEEKFWQHVLGEAGCCDTLVPVPRDRDYLLGLCEREFSQGIVTAAARADVVRIAHSLKQAGARAVVVLAPELTVVLEDAVPVLPIYDATELHALAAVDWMTGCQRIDRFFTTARESVAKTTKDGSVGR